MKEEKYRAILSLVKSHKGLAKSVVLIGKFITYIVYIFYPLFLVHLIAAGNPEWWRYILVPAVSFLVLSFVRCFLNFQRPYEKWDLEPLYQKNTKGKSFPSRHTFCAFIIAVATFYFYPIVGIVIGIAGIGLAITRVLCCVHFIRDVVAGMVCGLTFGFIGFYLI